MKIWQYISQFDNDAFNNGIQMSTEGSTAFAGTEITLAGTSNVSTVSIFNIGNIIYCFVMI